jgi:Tol biopolymer transport system component
MGQVIVNRTGTNLALSRAMQHVTFAELIKHRVPLAASEAVELTLAVAHLLDNRQAGGAVAHVPDDECILLGNTGQVTFTSVDGSTATDESSALSALVRRLLQLDEPAAGDRRKRVPGGLLVLLARAMRQIDLPPPEREEFRATLARFAPEGAPFAATLSVIFWRAASLRPSIGKKRKLIALLPAATPVSGAERRNHGVSRTELRRALRDLEREVFERPEPEIVTAAPASTARSWRPHLHEPRAAVAAALVGAALMAMIAGSGVLDRAADSAEPIMSTASAAPEQTPAAAASSRSVPLLTRALIGRDVFSPSFDPKGQAIYFHAGRSGAPLMRAVMTEKGTVGGVTKLLDDGAANYHVTMSPGGTAIAFDSNREGVRGVYVADADGRNPRRISGDGYASVPSWSPDGRRIAFAKAEPDKPRVWNVWVADVDDGALHRVTTHAVGQPWGASWFPDGRRIAYSRELELVILDLQAGRSTIIASPRAGHLVRTPAVSPDGSRVVFQVLGDGAWMLDLARMMLRRILADPSAEEFVWAPNGRTIAYHARDTDGWGVWTIGM